MCYVIESKQILANVLRCRSEVSIRDLKALASRISEELPSVVVDVSHYSLSAALEDFPNMFHRQDDTTIARTPQAEKCFEEHFIEVFFNQEIPQDIRAVFLQCVDPHHVEQAER